MATHPRRRLITLLWTAGLGGLLLVALLLLAPRAITRLFSPSTRRAQRTPVVSAEDVDAFIARGLVQVGVTELMERSDDGDTQRSTWRTPARDDPMDTARRLRELASAQGIELYISPEDGLDARLRVYAGTRLRQQILLVPSLPSTPPVVRPRYPRERPMVALIVGGLGDDAATDIVNSTLPLTVAIHPFQPFSLHAAEAAAQRWQEVLVHVPSGLLAGHLDVLPQAALGAIPHATGLLLDTAPGPALRSLPTELAVYPARYSPNRAPTGLTLLAAQQAGQSGALEALARTCTLAVRDGVAALVIDVHNPGLGDVLSWAARADQDGYRMVLASEATRADQTRGHVWEGVRTR